jgi:tetratricopeptide (TPR) repeat protein
MNENTPEKSQITKSIIGAIGPGNTVNQHIHLQLRQPTPHMLPTDIGDFTGRGDYISQIEEILTQGKIAAISGMSGVGKSALEIHIAHRLNARYPDAQLYVDLHGQTPEFALEPKKVLIQFLEALTGQKESQLATDLESLKGQYRSTLSDKRALIILDNARDEAQIRDLLPSSPNCAVIVTSRSRLTGLPGAGSINLEPMRVGIDRELGEAELLFQEILQDGKRVDAELSAAREIVKLCGGLPIAIRITAATLTQKIWAKKSLRVYAQELDTEITRLDKLDNKNVENAIPGQGSVRASFSLSYKILAEEDQQLFCWTGSLPGVNFGVAVLASVMNWGESEIKAGLNRLLEAQVLELRGEDRFGWHDLMRLFAKEQLKNSERKTVLGSGLNWYCKQAKDWGNALKSIHRKQIAQQLATKTGKTVEEWERDLPIMALNWFATEQDNWVDIVKYLAQIPRPNDAVNLVANLVPFFNLRGILGDWVETHEIVKECTERAGDSSGLARILNNLGDLYQTQEIWDKAIDNYEKSLAIFQQLKDENEIAITLNNLGDLYQAQGNLHKAIDNYEKSLAISHQLGDQDIAQPFNNLGDLYQRQGDFDKAIKYYNNSLGISRQLGHQNEISQTFNILGDLYQRQGNLDQAIYNYQKSLAVPSQMEDQKIAQILNDLGNLYQKQCCWSEAIYNYEKFLEVSYQLEEQEIAQVLNDLGDLYQRQGDFDKAINYYEKSIQSYPPLGYEHKIVETAGNLCNVYRNQGDMYESQGNWGRAIDNNDKSLMIFRLLGDKHKIFQTLTTLGNLYGKEGDMFGIQSDWSAAIDCYEKSLEIFQQLDDNYKIAQTIINLGNLHRSQGKYDMAIDCYEKSLEIFKQLGDNHSVGKTLMNLGQAYNKCSQTEQAHRQWQKALSYLNPGSYEIGAVRQWLPRQRKRRKVNYLFIFMKFSPSVVFVMGLTIFFIFKGIWLAAICSFVIFLNLLSEL